MATVNITTTATALSENTPYLVLDLDFTYGGTTTQNGTVLYYSATLSDGTATEYVLFSLPVTTATEIPSTVTFAYVPEEEFTGTVTASDGQVFYTA